MTYLPSLIKKIDEFCRWSEYNSTIKRVAAPPAWDDPNFGMEGGETSNEDAASVPYFDELMNAARQVDDPGLSQEVQVLAELYRYALQMGGGYASIARAIDNLKNMYGDSSDSDIEDILNGMIKELAKAAGGIGALSGKDNPGFVQRLIQLKQDIESRNREGRSEAIEAYNEEISGKGQGAQTEESEEDLEQAGLTKEDAEIINPAALGLDNKEDPKTNKGWHTTGSGRAYKNWKEYYENEKLAYEADLAGEDDPNNRKTIQQLIDLLPIISAKTAEALDLSNKLRSDIANPEAEAKARAELTAMREELQQLKHARRLLKYRIRSIKIGREQKILLAEEQELSERGHESPERAEKTRRELEVIQNKKALNILSLRNAVFKAKERNYLLDMVHQMSGKAWPAQNWIDKQKQKIEEADKLVISKEDYDRDLTEERGKQQARPETPSYENARGGRRIPMEQLPVEYQIDLEKASFTALVKKLQDDIASATQAARQIIYETGKKDKQGKKILNTEYKAIIDEISESIRKRNRQTLYIAEHKLMKAVSDDVNKTREQLKGYVEIIKLEPHFRKVLDDIKKCIKTEKNAPPKLDDLGNLLVANFAEKDKNDFEYILNDIHRLRVLYRKHGAIAFINVPGNARNIRIGIAARFKQVIEDMGKIETHLALKLHVRRPESKKLYPKRSPYLPDIAKKQKEEMEKKLKSSSISYRVHLFKIAQEITPANEIDKATADKLANEIFDRIFDEAYQKMLNELQS